MEGSIVSPATRAALYSMKPTVGSVPMDGCMSSVPTFETIGALAKSPQDLANVLAVMMNTTFSSPLSLSWHCLGVGFVDIKLWEPDPGFVTPNESFTKQYVRFPLPIR